MFKIECEQWLDAPLDKVFDFYSNAHNLERITPELLQFRVLTPKPIVMKEGVLIDYKLKLHGIPIRWQSQITSWNPPYEFVDEQLKGPYKSWHHRHTFVEKEGKVLVGDEVTYEVYGGKVIEKLFVRPDINKIFKYREDTLAQIFKS